MAITKEEFREVIKRRLGHPMVKVELAECNLNDAIDNARNLYIKWAAGQATYEHYMTVLLSAGQYLYDMPAGVTDVLSYEDQGYASGINTLFTIDNYMYMNGMYGGLDPGGGGGVFNSGYGLIGYQIALDFLENVQRYNPSRYNWKYHKVTNQLELNPPPPSGNNLTLSNGTYVDSPGWALVRLQMLEGSCLPQFTSTTSGAGNYNIDPTIDSIWYEHDWIQDYATAFAKKTLGYIRRKFANFSSLGNTGIAMDGDQLISEANEEMAALGETLRAEEVHEGWEILIG